MELKNVTWPSSNKVLKHFIITIIGIIFLIVFFSIIDSVISFIFENIYM